MITNVFIILNNSIYNIFPIFFIVFYFTMILRLLNQDGVLLNKLIKENCNGNLFMKKEMNKKLVLKKNPIKTKECPICFEVLKRTNKIILRCGHQYCCDCILIYITQNNNDNQTCPVCRNLMML
tara:strand:- start:5415 stop:5786 length:372 start_codon:yes stop_codon:yes gene_type:complete